MAITSGLGQPQNQNIYVAPNDIIETLPDGRQVQVIAKGVGIPMAEAVKKGLVKVNYEAVPSETKPKKGGKETKEVEAPPPGGQGDNTPPPPPPDPDGDKDKDK